MRGLTQRWKPDYTETPDITDMRNTADSLSHEWTQMKDHKSPQMANRVEYCAVECPAACWMWYCWRLPHAKHMPILENLKTLKTWKPYNLKTRNLSHHHLSVRIISWLFVCINPKGSQLTIWRNWWQSGLSYWYWHLCCYLVHVPATSNSKKAAREQTSFTGSGMVG